QRLANTHDPLALMENTQTPSHPDQTSPITHQQHPQSNNNIIKQPSFNTKYMPQPMQNLKDNSDPITAMNKALALVAKAFKINTIPINNNQRSSVIPHNSQIAQPGINTSQDINMKMVDDNVGNQKLQISMGMEMLLQHRLRVMVMVSMIALKEEAGIQRTQEEFEFMAAADAYEETEIVKVSYTLEDTLQQASISRTQSDNAPVYDSDGLAKVHHYDNCYNNDMFNMLTHEVPYPDLQTELDRTKEKLENCIIKKEKEYAVLWNQWYTKCEECKYDKISYDKAYNDMQQKIKRVNNTAKTKRPHPRSNFNSNRVPSKSKSSFLSNNVEKIEENHRNSHIPKNQKHTSSEFTTNHDVCALNYVNDMNSRADNQSAIVSIHENKKKHKANTKKSKELGSKRSLASSRPSKPRTCLRWIPTGRIFAMCGKLTASSNTENKSKKSSWKVYSVICSTNDSNGENQVVSKSSAITTADASDKRQQQQDSALYSSNLATTITADGNFDL
nr:hypothetical protein [Tanacetum cinerariifolium]